MTNHLLIGLMSGTSADGIDATLVEFDSGNELKVIGSQFSAYPAELKQRINELALSKSKLDDSIVEQLDIELADYYAKSCLDLIEELDVAKNDISAIANHGQTIRHEPKARSPYSLQVGNTQLIANQTQLPTISQFRQADMLVGGQGAPLIPGFHNAVFAEQQPCSIVNIGGIANVTALNHTSDKPTVGFDCGPGNTLMDQWISRHLDQSFDNNGEWAKQGKVNKAALTKLLKDPYILESPPKSTGPDYFNLAWLQKKLTLTVLKKLKPEDVQATLLAFTIECITQSVEQLEMSDKPLYLCGGGAHNLELVSGLKKRLPNCEIEPTDKIGVPADWVESAGFAWLGYCFLENLPANLPEVTGARKLVILGEIRYPKG